MNVKTKTKLYQSTKKTNSQGHRPGRADGDWSPPQNVKGVRRPAGDVLHIIIMSIDFSFCLPVSNNQCSANLPKSSFHYFSNNYMNKIPPVAHIHRLPGFVYNKHEPETQVLTQSRGFTNPSCSLVGTRGPERWDLNMLAPCNHVLPVPPEDSTDLVEISHTLNQIDVTDKNVQLTLITRVHSHCRLSCCLLFVSFVCKVKVNVDLYSALS